MKTKIDNHTSQSKNTTTINRKNITSDASGPPARKVDKNSKKRKRDEAETIINEPKEKRQKTYFFRNYDQDAPGSSKSYKDAPGSSKQPTSLDLENVPAEVSVSYVQARMYPS